MLAATLLPCVRAPKPMWGDDQDFIQHCIFQYVKAEATKYTAATKRSPALVQVGAHLAWLNPNDPFKSFSSEGFTTILVEPQPRIYERLAKAAEGVDSVKVLNNAVCNTTTQIKFYAVKPDEGEAHVEDSRGSNMASQVASLSREHVLKHKKWVKDIEDRIIEIDVQCETVETILKREGLLTDDGHSDVFILSVDAEGFDADILMSVDWVKVRPRLVLYEHIHLMATPEGRIKAGNVEFTLMSHGYTCFKEKENMWCVGGEDEQTDAEHKAWSPCGTPALKAELSPEQLKIRFYGMQFPLCGFGYKKPDVAPRIPSERPCSRSSRRRMAGTEGIPTNRNSTSRTPSYERRTRPRGEVV